MTVLVKYNIHPCGGRSYIDYENMCERCISCFSVIGSIGQPAQCKEIAEKYNTLTRLGGGDWDYSQGKFVRSALEVKS